MTVPDAETLRAVLAASRVPKSLDRLLEDAEEEIGPIGAFTWLDVLTGLLAEPTPSGALHHEMRQRLAAWDHASRDLAWTEGTERNTDERRAVVLGRLALPEGLRLHVEDNIPPARPEPPIVIAESRPDWYDPAGHARQHWESYAAYLEETRRWPSASIASLDEATDEIMSMLADPKARPERRVGLAVGYVQSGKTANITGLIAKAVDSGYRLVIVLSGTTNLLRSQTQRRLDKELVGKAALGPDRSYVNDPDWNEFNDRRPPTTATGLPTWLRFTEYLSDFRSQPHAALVGLADPDSVSLLVVKKNTAPLKRLIKAIRDSSASDIPALIIDDESDQASVNTGAAQNRRTAINRRVVELRKLLGRAQYIGYTATPFANVFIDLTNEEDLFPRDFIVSLPRPEGYMGASDFHDLDGLAEGAEGDPAISNERAFTRPVSDADDEEKLREAIDSFLLSGALKVFREERGYGSFRHHTMLVHTSHLVADHFQIAERVRNLYQCADYRGGIRRLWQLYKKDHEGVTLAREPDAPAPTSSRELVTAVGRCLDLVHADGADPVLIVNGSDLGADPDFDVRRVWRILIGGAKLSRGYTVEGLTVSFFTKTPAAQDALMQMGRWFGFRSNYLDLVRLYIARSQARGRTTYDTLLAFEAACRDEEAFREELRKYSEGPEPIKPFQVPPLVTSHLPTLPPTAPGKRFNARIKTKNLGGTWSQPTLLPPDSAPEKLQENLDAVEALLPESLIECSLRLGDHSFDALVGAVPLERLVVMLDSFRWAEDALPVHHEKLFLQQNTDIDPKIDDVAVVVPLTSARENCIELGGSMVPVRTRARTSTGRVKVIGEPEHRNAALYITGEGPEGLRPNAALDELRAPRRAVLLLYATATDREVVREVAGGDVPATIGFEIRFPDNGQERHAVWTVAEAGSRPVVDDASVGVGEGS